MSEYTSRYEGVGHQQLYDGVMAGQPGQIDGIAAQWTSLKGMLDGLSRDLSSDLDKLANTWTGSASQEFQRRLTLVTDYADTLGEGMADVSRGLTLMAGELRTARKQAESPAETDDHDQTLSGAAKGAVFGVPGMVIGGLLGHQQDKAEQEKAHKRMVKVVAELAAGYDLSAYGRLVAPPPPHPDTPGRTSRDPSTTPRSGPKATTPTAAPTTTGLDGRPKRATVAAPDRPGSGPDGGNSGTLTPGVVGGGHPGSGATGGTPGVVVTGTDTGTSLAGATPLAPTAVTGPGGPGGTSTASASLQFGPQGSGPAGGVLGTGALAGSSGNAPTSAVRSAGGSPMADNRSATGMGRRFDNSRDGARQGAAGDRAATGTGRSGGARGAANRHGVLGAGQGAHDDDADGRLTWLTEDDMVWGNDASAAPPVLGTDG
ncbi:WXG100 family type VII secretion target [Micromonospora peucetia]|uniref:Proteins of 100 residues with WXG n=1 Tax=Micromonospora peucetia TaxID=47871 RepID=A0A1C6UMR5_9ACTN|nr:WXG100 family type VII secretion target [Micromonospora peucetia]MCX4387038.1 WXG100 family type VII secretion target [Micromonospora peucetia]WSA34405.1 WXG100 family type VII secretion target [Micromonospora peucetia]SCL55189.1 Proteins of 100 residues with WXG [Micromonospora peucetia]